MNELDHLILREMCLHDLLWVLDAGGVAEPFAGWERVFEKSISFYSQSPTKKPKYFVIQVCDE